jgi:hypothetical protein
MTDFAETLYHKNRDPLMLVVDEADAYAPQRPQKGEERLLGAMEDLVRRGRARGLGVMLVTQRAAVLNKNVLTQVEVLIVLRTIAPQDREAIDAWVKVYGSQEQRETLMGSLASLKIGEAWFWSPGWLDTFKRVQVRPRDTFDSSATPKQGETKKAPKKLADVDLAALTQRIAATIEKAKAEDPRELRKQIAELTKQLKSVPVQKIVPAGTNSPAKVRDVLTEADRELLRKLDQRFAETIDAITEKTDLMLQSIAARATTAIEQTFAAWSNYTNHARGEFLAQLEKTGVQRVLAKLDAIQHQTPPASVSIHASPQAPAATRRALVQMAQRGAKELRTTEPPSGALPTGERKILTAIAQANERGATREQLTVVTGYKRSSRDTYLQRLQQRGYINSVADRLFPSVEGLDALGTDYEPLPTGDELREHWLRELPEGERKVLEVLVMHHPKAIEREIIDEHTGYKRSSRDTYLQRLSARQLVIPEGRGAVRASDQLFS